MGEIFGLAYDEDLHVYATATANPYYVGNFSIADGDPLIYFVNAFTGVASGFTNATSGPTTVGTNMINNNRMNDLLDTHHTQLA